MSLQSSFSDLVDRLGGWFAATDQAGLLVAVVVVAIVFWARKPLAAFIVSSVNRLMTRLSVGISEEAQNELKQSTAVLIVLLSIYLSVEVLHLPEIAGGVVLRVLASVAILAVFSSWYNLCGAFVSLLSGDERLDINVETGWMERVARFGVVLFGITSLLTVWEVDISGALTGVGVLGAGLAIATQDLIRNLVAGMNNLSEKRFSVGDTVQIEGAFIGTVEQIDLRSTLLRGFDQIPRYVPNSELSNAVVLNYSQMRNRRVRQSIPFVLSLSPGQVTGLRDDLMDHLMNSGDFDTSPSAPKYVQLEGMTDSAILLLFYGRTVDADYTGYLAVVERLTLKILELSRKHDAPFAYPTHTVRIDESGKLPVDPG